MPFSLFIKTYQQAKFWGNFKKSVGTNMQHLTFRKTVFHFVFLEKKKIFDRHFVFEVENIHTPD